MYRPVRCAAVATLLVLMGVSGCRSDSTYPGCIGAAEYGDTTYHEVGFTNREGEALKESASFATCATVNRDGASKALREESAAVQARSLPGYRPEQVIAVQVTDSAWSVLVSDDAPERLLRQIREAGLLDAGEQ